MFRLLTQPANRSVPGTLICRFTAILIISLSLSLINSAHSFYFLIKPTGNVLRLRARCASPCHLRSAALSGDDKPTLRFHKTMNRRLDQIRMLRQVGQTCGNNASTEIKIFSLPKYDDLLVAIRNFRLSPFTPESIHPAKPLERIPPEESGQSKQREQKAA